MQTLQTRSVLPWTDSFSFRLDPANVEAVLSLKKSNPSTVGEVRKLLGLLGNYRRYIPNFARMAYPLYQLLHADRDNVARTVRGNKQHSKRGSVPSSKPVVWEEQHQKALEKLLDHLTSAPVLGYPDFSQPCTRDKMGKCVLSALGHGHLPRQNEITICTLANSSSWH